MPLIPIFKESPKTAAAPAPVLDNLKRPTADFSRVASLEGSLADAAKNPELPNSLAQPWEALAGLGQSISQAGGILGATLHKRQEAKSYTQAHSAEIKMEEAQNELEQFQADNPTNPDAWEPKRQELVDRLRSTFEQDKDLTPDARDHINQKLDLYNVRSKGATFRDSSKAHFNYAKSAAFDTMETASRDGNKEAFDVAARTALNNGWAFPDQIHAQQDKYDYEQKRKQKEAEALAEKTHIQGEQAIIAMDPGQWLKDNPKPREGEDPATHYKLRTFAEGMERDVTADVSEDVGNKIITGDITTPAEIDALAAPGLTPKVKQQLKDDLIKFDKRKSEVEKLQNGDANFVKMWVGLDKINFDAMPTPEARAVAFNKLMNEAKRTLPDDRVGEVTQRLHAMFGVPGGSGKVRPPLQRQVTKTMDVAYNGWLFGRLADWDPNKDNGKGKPKGGNVANPKLEFDALKRRTAAELEMEQFFKSNPGADEKAVQAKMNQVIDRNTSTQAAGAIIKPKPVLQSFTPGEVHTAPYDWKKTLKDIGAPEGTEEPETKPEPGGEPASENEPPKPKTKKERDIQEAESDVLKRGTKKELDLLPGGGMSNALLPDIPFNE